MTSSRKMVSATMALWGAVRSEWHAAHAGSLGGRAWLFAAPLLQLGLYALLFGVIWQLRVRVGPLAEVPFLGFLVAAYLPFWALQDALTRGSGALLSQAHLIRHAPVVPWVLVVARLLVPYGVLAVVVPLVWGSFLWAGVFRLGGWDALALAGVAAAQLAITVGWGLCLAVLVVVVRDVANLVAPLLMLMVLTAPVFYPLTNVPPSWQPWLWVNPFTPLAQGYHVLLLSGDGLPPWHWAVLGVHAALALALGAGAYRRLRPDLVDVL